MGRCSNTSPESTHKANAEITQSNTTIATYVIICHYIAEFVQSIYRFLYYRDNHCFWQSKCVKLLLRNAQHFPRLGRTSCRTDLCLPTEEECWERQIQDCPRRTGLHDRYKNEEQSVQNCRVAYLAICVIFCVIVLALCVNSGGVLN